MTSLDRELVGDDEAVPLSSSMGVLTVVTDRLNGCTKDVDECTRFANVNKLGDDIRESGLLDVGDERS